MIYWVLFLHFISDFPLQPRWVAERKSFDMNALYTHMLIISGVFFLGLIPFMSLHNTLLFAVPYTLLHGVQDRFIWRSYRKGREGQPSRCEFWKDKMFWDTLGFDQALHIFLLVYLTMEVAR